MKRAWTMVVVAVVASGAVGGCDGGVFETSHGAVDDGNEELLAGKLDAALKSYAEAVAAIPESPELDYDRGLAESLAGHHEQATQLLLRALDSRQAPMLQKVQAALGVAYSRWGVALERTASVAPAKPGDDGTTPTPEAPPEDAKDSPQAQALEKWTLAVQHLEEALRMDPNDQASLHNLEVALLRVDPPCSARDDEHEKNDSRETATTIEAKAEQDPAKAQSGGTPQAPELARDVLKWTEQLYSCPDDADWYQIDLDAGDRLSGTLTVPDKPGAKLSLTVLGPDGAALSPGVGADGKPATSFDLSATPAQAGTYTLRVDNVELDESAYGLEVKVRPACESVDDRFEQNDTEAQAPLLTPGPLDGLKLCPSDDDWYAIDLAEGESLFLYVQQAAGGEDDEAKAKIDPSGAGGPAPPPPFTTEIHAADGALLAAGGPTGKGRVTTLLTPGAGRYFIRVAGTGAFEGRYDMNVQVVPPCPEGDDRFEDNDIPQDAVDVAQAAQQAQAGGGQPGPDGAPPAPQPGAGAQGGPPTLFARVCPGDVDWFKYTEQGDKPSVVTAVFEHAKGDLKLELYDETGATEIASSDTSSPAQNGEAVALPPRPEEDDTKTGANAGTASGPNAGGPGGGAAEKPPRTFTIKVSAAPDAQNFYLLEIQQPSPSPGGDSQDKNDDKDKSDDKSKDDKQDQDQKPDKDKGKDPDKDQQDQAKAKNEPLQDALDKLDRNPENLEAVESAKKSPLANGRPVKDW